MPKPQGSIGATKIKILAVICHNKECGQESYGYDIWKTMQDYFHIYLDDSDIGNVYHHLIDMSKMELVTRDDPNNPEGRCFYNLTEKGLEIKPKFSHYLVILDNEKKGKVNK